MANPVVYRSLKLNRSVVSGPGDYIQQKFNQMLGGGAAGLWHKVMNMGGGGFAKGAIVAAVLFVAAWGIGAGAMGAAGALAVNGLTMTTFEAGAAAGISKGIGLLLGTFAGWGVLAAGGGAGILFEKGKQAQHSLSPEEARTQARQYELERQRRRKQEYQPPMPSQEQGKEQGQDAAPPAPVPDSGKPKTAEQPVSAAEPEAPQKNFCSDVAGRRAYNMKMKNQQEPGDHGRC